MSARIRNASLLLLGLALTACGGGPVKRIYPPQASIQELSLQADGRWQLRLRVENFSTVNMRLDALQLQLTVAGLDAGSLSLTPQLTVSPESAEVLAITHAPSAAARAALAGSSRNGLRYRLAGSLEVGEPKGRYDTEFESVLSPVPGLDGIFR